LHFGWADACDSPKCGLLGYAIYLCGDCVRAIPEKDNKNQTQEKSINTGMLPVLKKIDYHLNALHTSHKALIVYKKSQISLYSFNHNGHSQSQCSFPGELDVYNLLNADRRYPARKLRRKLWRNGFERTAQHVF